MKSIIALISLLAATSASANTLAVQLVPCGESICGKVLQDRTTKKTYTDAQPMTIVSDFMIREALMGVFTAAITARKPYPIIGIEGRIYDVYSGLTKQIKADNIAPLQ